MVERRIKIVEHQKKRKQEKRRNKSQKDER